MKTYEFLKEIYKDAKSTYEYMRAENYRLSFEKFRNFLWVNLALFTAGLFFIKFFKTTPVEIFIFMIINLAISTFIIWEISTVRRNFKNIKKVEDIGYDKDIDWVYEKIINHPKKEEAFYVELIREKERAIFNESKRVLNNAKKYKIILIFIIIESAILFFSFYKYSQGG